jgi:protein tyrosine/serine phosphatase
VIATTGMGKNILYRTSSPINPKHKRSTYADAAIEKAGVVTIMNLADSMKKAKSFKGYAKTYYSTTNFVALDMGLAFNTDEFRKKMAEGLVFFANNKGPYAVHCKEGKNRAGVASALLECFMGATYDEIVSDYMVTYYNYYGIKPGDKRYDDIAQKNIVATLQTMFNVDDLKTADLSKEAEEFFKEIGLSDEDIENLRNNLSESRSDQ